MHLLCLQQTERATGMCLFSDGYFSSLQNTAYCFNNKQEKKKAAKSLFPSLYITIYFTAQLLAAGVVTIRLRESHSWKKKNKTKTQQRTDHYRAALPSVQILDCVGTKLNFNSLILGAFKWLLSTAQELWGRDRSMTATLTAHPSLPRQT